MSTLPARGPSALAGVRESSGVTLALLQGFRLDLDGCEFELPLGIQRLVAFLAVHNRPLQRLFVAGNLWIDSSEGAREREPQDCALAASADLGFRLDRGDEKASSRSRRASSSTCMWSRGPARRQVLRH